ncbi:MAG: hypothetical protein LBS77_02800 [Desulfovibrio sp.]|jgi:hypothetical protein|nr:hypothetical protein [Desulfovibrio sp.]
MPHLLYVAGYAVARAGCPHRPHAPGVKIGLHFYNVHKFLIIIHNIILNFVFIGGGCGAGEKIEDEVAVFNTCHFQELNYYWSY